MVDESFNVRRDPASQERFAILSNSLRDADNALDSRSPGIIPTVDVTANEQLELW